MATSTTQAGARPDWRYLMLKNFSSPMSGAKPRLGHHIVGQVQGHAIGDDGGVAVGDVGKGAGVDQHRVCPWSASGWVAGRL